VTSAAARGEGRFPLPPYRVLDLTTAGARIAGQVLADLGADVIAISGDGAEAIPMPEWQAYGRGKRELRLDGSSFREGVISLAEEADVLLESFAPGSLDSLGLGYEPLASRNPGLVVVSVTPFGQTGPKAGWQATDLTVLAASGVLLLTGDADRPPVQVPGGQAMLHAGVEAAAAALIALAARRRDGLGQHVDVSAQEVMTIATQAFALTAAWNDPVQVSRAGGGAMVGGRHIRYVYPCADGYVAVTFLFGNVIGPFTRRLFEWMCEEGVVDEATRDKDWVGYYLHLLDGSEPDSELERCTRAVEKFTLRHTKAELAAAALERGLLIVPVSTIGDLLASPQLEARGFWRTIAESGQTFAVPGPFARFSSTPVGRWESPSRRPAAAGWSHPRPDFAPTAGESRGPALEGLNVLDLSWVYATPAGVRTLADYGATVVHVESPARPDTLRSAQPFKDGIPGPERSGQYSTIQANKLGLSANLSIDTGRSLVRRLAIEWADVVVESFSPGTMDRLGLGFSTLSAEKPSLIMLSSCLNGQDGPQARLAGFGTMGGHLAGFGHLTGWPDRPPAGPFTAYTDYTTPKFVTAAILAALEHRDRTGEGQYIDLGQVEAATHYLAPALIAAQLGNDPVRDGNHSPLMAPHGVYPAGGEERWIAIACPGSSEWQALCRLAGPALAEPEFETLESRLSHSVALDAAIATWTEGWAIDDLETALQAAGVPAHRCSTSADLFADPQFAARGHWVTVDHPELGPVVVEAPRSRMSRTPPATWGPGPAFGQHNDRILREFLGLQDEEIVELAASGALS
jgi:crotonobetainyl-CoA:carnitine CoA-transferase CaiB-like acyl-CoA transferase